MFFDVEIGVSVPIDDNHGIHKESCFTPSLDVGVVNMYPLV